MGFMGKACLRWAFEGKDLGRQGGPWNGWNPKEDLLRPTCLPWQREVTQVLNLAPSPHSPPPTPESTGGLARPQRRWGQGPGAHVP